MNKHVQLLGEIVPENVLNQCLFDEDGFVKHYVTTASQAASHAALASVIREGYVVDVLNDSSPTLTVFIEGMDGQDLMGLKTVYNTHVTPPSNALYKWRINTSVSRSQKAAEEAENVKKYTTSTQKLAGIMEDVLTSVFKVDRNKEGDPEVSINEAFIDTDCIQDIKAPRPNKYMRKIKTFESHDINGSPIEIDVWVDVYDVIKAFNVTSGPMQHALKKVLCAGERGHKDLLEDLNDIIVSVEREIEMVKEGK
ncbi:hypothetical protein AVU33_gp36 [Enterobacteria phage JenP2]|uniref:Uncharacterized protein n=1 Tax=Enterobacteria phage JenP2 TaxID=1610838 RepID=A0A0E3M2S0_9CAUD|nr:hypothetical protein AVU33_gp36 [Enterobacteria phage JenP2]AKA60989.1 hypothetical protein [Enterobacteria phage JenP2]